MVHVVMRLRPYETALAHDDARRSEVLHPVAPLKLISDTHLSLHCDLDSLGFPSLSLCLC